jgi:ubiquinone/menaquinone biosynthesis C-methylase UbiE
MASRSVPVRIARRIAGTAIRSIPWLRRQVYPSSDHRVISEQQARNTHSDGWLSGLSARRQEKAYEDLLAGMRGGDPRIDLTVAADAIRASGLPKPSILEVGCGGGYYLDVFRHYFGDAFSYLGTDYSTAMIERARVRDPAGRFEVADATALPFEAASFDIVFNGVSLMHILDYERAIAESRRVARAFCVFHTVPVLDHRQTTYFSKYAYGGLVVEMVFNRATLLSCFERNGLQLVQCWQSIPYDVYESVGEHSRCETFLLRVKGVQ